MTDLPIIEEQGSEEEPCSYDPTTVDINPELAGLHHCPECDDIVYAGLPHGTRIHLSASQLKLRMDCERAYWFEKVADVLPRGEGTGATKLGSEVHEILEEYLTTGTVREAPHSRAELIAYRTLHLLPMPGYCLVEEELVIAPVDGIPVPFLGYVDVFIPDQGAVREQLPTFEDETGAESCEPLGPVDGVPLVNDHKTSSYPYKWGLWDETLSQDLQAIIYAYWALFIMCPEAECVDLRWTYSGTRKAETKIAQCRMTREEVHEAWLVRVVPWALRIVETREKQDQEECEYNLRSCGKFGGCRFRPYCNQPERGTPEALEAKYGSYFDD